LYNKSASNARPYCVSSYLYNSKININLFAQLISWHVARLTAPHHVGNDESALDIVQDSMMKLAEHYGDKPTDELPMLFARILGNTTLDWFRRQKVKNAFFSSLSDFQSDPDDTESDILESLSSTEMSLEFENPQTTAERTETLQMIEKALLLLPTRQRNAFLMRYWEGMNVLETASAMGCSEGSIKTHCSRAAQALSRALHAKGLTP